MAEAPILKGATRASDAALEAVPVVTRMLDLLLARTTDSRAADLPLTAAERRSAAVVGGGFVLAVLALLVLSPSHGQVDVLRAAFCIAALTVAVHVRFEVGGSFTAPTQLAYVPLLFTLPPALVPPATLLALTAAGALDVVRGHLGPSRLAHLPGNCWFTIGPAIVLSAAPADLTVGHAEGWLAAAVAAQFASDFVASAVRERLAGGATLREQAAEALWIAGVDAALTPVAVLGAWALHEQPLAVLSFIPLVGVLSIFARERTRRIEQLKELGAAYRGTALVLGDVVEADDGYTGDHCKDVLELAVSVATEMRLDARELRLVEFGALLHDVGKIAIPKSLINKPGPLDDGEWAVMRTHTVEGQRILDRVGGVMREVGRVVRASHEHWDGSGYPDGLAGEEIPLAARVVIACDAYHAMTTSRSYRAALSPRVAVGELRRCSGTQFDPAVVDALLAVLGREDPAVLATGPHEIPPEAPDVRDAARHARAAA
jgi:putative nucleotidyltransferase with HDIG domain